MVWAQMFTKSYHLINIFVFGDGQIVVFFFDKL